MTIKMQEDGLERSTIRNAIRIRSFYRFKKIPLPDTLLPKKDKNNRSKDIHSLLNINDTKEAMKKANIGYKAMIVIKQYID